MPFRLAPFAPVLLGVVCAQVALGIMTPLIPILLLKVGASSEEIGLVASAYFFGFLCGALIADRIVTSVGHIRAFAVFATLSADAALLLVFASNAWIVAGLRVLIGFACSGVFLVAESWLNDRADATNRGRAFAAYLVASWGGAAVGPLTLNVVTPAPVMFVLVGVAFATALLPMALTHQPNPQIQSQMHINLRRVFAISPAGVVCVLASGLLNSAFYSLIPVVMERRGFVAGDVSALLAACTVTGLVVQVPIGILSDRIGRRRVMLGVLAVALAASLLLGLVNADSLALLIPLACLFAGMTAPLYGLGAGQTNDRMERGDYVAASGGLLFAWSLGSTVGPSIAGGVMGRLGPVGLFAYTAAVLVTVGLFLLARMVMRRGVPPELRAVFVAAPSTPPRHVELMPRTAMAARRLAPCGARVPFWRSILLRWSTSR